MDTMANGNDNSSGIVMMVGSNDKSVARWTLGDVQRMAHEYETILPDEVRELMARLALEGAGAVDWTEDAETGELPQAPPWEDSWVVERQLSSGRWARVTTVPPAPTRGEAFDSAYAEGFRRLDLERLWRVREVGDLVFARVGGGFGGGR